MEVPQTKLVTIEEYDFYKVEFEIAVPKGTKAEGYKSIFQDYLAELHLKTKGRTKFKNIKMYRDPKPIDFRAISLIE